jgi:hypothetical protein
MIYDYLVMDERFHRDPSQGEIYFATSDLAEAKLVANEVGNDFVVVRSAAEVEDYELVYGAAFNTELPLDP